MSACPFDGAGPYRLDEVIAWTSVEGREVLHVRREGSTVEIPVRIADASMRDHEWNVRFDTSA